MNKSNIIAVIFGILMLTIVIILANGWLRSLPQELTLRFHPYVGDKPLVLNNKSYKNPGGNGEFSIRDFQLFISNIVLNYPSSSLNEPESYHLLRFDGKTHFAQLDIARIKLKKLRQLSFGIGIDPQANGTILFSGDLDPNSRMAWNWQVGYKFLLLEGSLTVKNEQLPLVYHIGFNESYTKLNFDIADKNIIRDGVINFKIDLLRLFQKPRPQTKQLTNQPLNKDIKYIDMSEMSHVKFAPDDVKVIANGFRDFISIM